MTYDNTVNQYITIFGLNTKIQRKYSILKTKRKGQRTLFVN